MKRTTSAFMELQKSYSTISVVIHVNYRSCFHPNDIIICLVRCLVSVVS